MKYKLYGSSRTLNPDELSEIMGNKRQMRYDKFIALIKTKDIYEATGLSRGITSLYKNRMVEYYRSKIQGKYCYMISVGGIVYVFTEVGK